MKKQPPPEVVDRITVWDPVWGRFSMRIQSINPRDNLPYNVHLLKVAPNVWVVPARPLHHLMLTVDNGSSYVLRVPVALLYNSQDNVMTLHSIFGPETVCPDFTVVVEQECWEIDPGDSFPISSLMQHKAGKWQYEEPFVMGVGQDSAVIQPGYAGVMLDVGTIHKGTYTSLIEDGPFRFVFEPEREVERRFFEQSGRSYLRWFT